MARYLVTGGAGFIGSHLAERLLADGHEVRVLDNLATGRRENLDLLQERGGGRLDVVVGDIRSAETCAAVCRGVECVFHQAALASVQRSIERPSETADVNVVGTVRILQAAREAGVRRVVFASSSSVYGDTPTLPKEEAMQPAPRSPYAVSKLAGEQYALLFATGLGLETVSLRYFNVFGPRQDPTSQYAAVVPLFLTALLQGKSPTIYGDGEQSRDFTYIENVVEANLRGATEGPGDGAVLNIACGERYTLLELLRVLGEATGIHPNPVFAAPRIGDVMHSMAAIDRARRVLSFTPRIGFEEGIRRTVATFQNAT